MAEYNFYNMAGDGAKWREEMKSLPNRGEALIALQRKQHSRGVTKADMTLSIYGWVLRYASGLNGFSIIRKLNTNNARVAVKAAEEWVKGRESHRSVFVRGTAAKNCLEKHGEDILAVLKERDGELSGW